METSVLRTSSLESVQESSRDSHSIEIWETADLSTTEDVEETATTSLPLVTVEVNVAIFSPILVLLVPIVILPVVNYFKTQEDVPSVLVLQVSFVLINFPITVLKLMLQSALILAFPSLTDSVA